MSPQPLSPAAPPSAQPPVSPADDATHVLPAAPRTLYSAAPQHLPPSQPHPNWAAFGHPVPAGQCAPHPNRYPSIPGAPVPPAWAFGDRTAAAPKRPTTTGLWFLVIMLVLTVAVSTYAIGTRVLDRDDDGPAAASASNNPNQGTRIIAPPPLSKDEPASVPTSALEGLLLDAAALRDVVRVPLDPAEVRYPAQMYIDDVDIADCAGAVVPASQIAYADSGWVSVRKNVHTNPDTRGSVTQAVVAFPDAQRARDFIANEALRQHRCEGQTVVLNPDDDPADVVVLSVNDTPRGLNTVVVGNRARDAGCDRALRQVANLVIDTQSCGAQPSSKAAHIADQIAARIPA
jgi:hypothetical protein